MITEDSLRGSAWLVYFTNGVCGGQIKPRGLIVVNSSNQIIKQHVHVSRAPLGAGISADTLYKGI